MSTPATMTPSAPWEHTLDPALTMRGPHPFRRYLFSFFLLATVAYVAAFFLIRSNAYSKWRDSQWGPMLEYSYNPGPRSADVVIFGDSSAFIGIDPRLIEQQLPVSALLLPNTIGSLPITGDMPLKRYLASHKPPKLLILYFSPWNLNYHHAANVRLFEGEEMIFRHGTGREIAGFILHYPAQFLFFPFRFYNTYGAGMVRSLLPHFQQRRASVDAALGHLEDRDPFPQMAPGCTIPSRLTDDHSETAVAELANTYRKRVAVLVYMAPIPGCSNATTALQRSFQEVGATPPVVLPATDFVGDPYYGHVEPAAVPVATQLITKAIQSRLLLPTRAAEP